jgi:hypothetical protein
MTMRKILIIALAVLGLTFSVAGQRRQSRSGQARSTKDPATAVVVAFTGTLRSVSKKEILIASPEGQEITFHRSKKTEFLKGSKEIKPEEIPEHSEVTVEASKDVTGLLSALRVIRP